MPPVSRLMVQKEATAVASWQHVYEGVEISLPEPGKRPRYSEQATGGGRAVAASDTVATFKKALLDGEHKTFEVNKDTGRCEMEPNEPELSSFSNRLDLLPKQAETTAPVNGQGRIHAGMFEDSDTEVQDSDVQHLTSNEDLPEEYPEAILERSMLLRNVRQRSQSARQLKAQSSSTHQCMQTKRSPKEAKEAAEAERRRVEEEGVQRMRELRKLGRRSYAQQENGERPFLKLSKPPSLGVKSSKHKRPGSQTVVLSSKHDVFQYPSTPDRRQSVTTSLAKQLGNAAYHPWSSLFRSQRPPKSSRDSARETAHINRLLDYVQTELVGCKETKRFEASSRSRCSTFERIESPTDGTSLGLNDQDAPSSASQAGKPDNDSSRGQFEGYELDGRFIDSSGDEKHDRLETNVESKALITRPRVQRTPFRKFHGLPRQSSKSKRSGASRSSVSSQPCYNVWEEDGDEPTTPNSASLQLNNSCQSNEDLPMAPHIASDAATSSTTRPEGRLALLAKKRAEERGEQSSEKHQQRNSPFESSEGGAQVSWKEKFLPFSIQEQLVEAAPSSKFTMMEQHWLKEKEKYLRNLKEAFLETAKLLFNTEVDRKISLQVHELKICYQCLQTNREPNVTSKRIQQIRCNMKNRSANYVPPSREDIETTLRRLLGRHGFQSLCKEWETLHAHVIDKGARCSWDINAKIGNQFLRGKKSSAKQATMADDETIPCNLSGKEQKQSQARGGSPVIQPRQKPTREELSARGKRQYEERENRAIDVARFRLQVFDAQSARLKEALQVNKPQSASEVVRPPDQHSQGTTDAHSDLLKENLRRRAARERGEELGSVFVPRPNTFEDDMEFENEMNEMGLHKGSDEGPLSDGERCKAQGLVSSARSDLTPSDLDEDDSDGFEAGSRCVMGEKDDDYEDDRAKPVSYTILATCSGMSQFGYKDDLVTTRGILFDGQSGSRWSQAEDLVRDTIEWISELHWRNTIRSNQFVPAGVSAKRTTVEMQGERMVSMKVEFGEVFSPDDDNQHPYEWKQSCRVWIEKNELVIGQPEPDDKDGQNHHHTVLACRITYTVVFEKTIEDLETGQIVEVTKPAWDEVKEFSSPVHAVKEAKSVMMGWYGKFFGEEYRKILENDMDALTTMDLDEEDDDEGSATERREAAISWTREDDMVLQPGPVGRRMREKMKVWVQRRGGN